MVDRQFSDCDIGDERSGNGHFESGSDARYVDSFRPRSAIHTVGVHPPGPRLGVGPVNGIDRRLLRQCRHRIILGQNANRTLEPETMENENRTGQRHVRVPRDLPQPPTSAQYPRDADTDRVRERTLHTPTRSLKSNMMAPRNSGYIIPRKLRCASIRPCRRRVLRQEFPIRRVEGLGRRRAASTPAQCLRP